MSTCDLLYEHMNIYAFWQSCKWPTSYTCVCCSWVHILHYTTRAWNIIFTITSWSPCNTRANIWTYKLVYWFFSPVVFKYRPITTIILLFWAFTYVYTYIYVQLKSDNFMIKDSQRIDDKSRHFQPGKSGSDIHIHVAHPSSLEIYCSSKSVVNAWSIFKKNIYIITLKCIRNCTNGKGHPPSWCTVTYVTVHRCVTVNIQRIYRW